MKTLYYFLFTSLFLSKVMGTEPEKSLSMYDCLWTQKQIFRIFYFLSPDEMLKSFSDSKTSYGFKTSDGTVFVNGSSYRDMLDIISDGKMGTELALKLPNFPDDPYPKNYAAKFLLGSDWDGVEGKINSTKMNAALRSVKKVLIPRLVATKNCLESISDRAGQFLSLGQPLIILDGNSNTGSTWKFQERERQRDLYSFGGKYSFFAIKGTVPVRGTNSLMYGTATISRGTPDTFRFEIEAVNGNGQFWNIPVDEDVGQSLLPAEGDFTSSAVYLSPLS